MKKKHCNDLAKGVLIFHKSKKANLDLRSLIKSELYCQHLDAWKVMSPQKNSGALISKLEKKTKSL